LEIIAILVNLAKMDQLKCHYVSQVALYSQKVLYGYNKELEDLFANIKYIKRLITIEDNLVACGLNGSVITELNKYKNNLTLQSVNTLEICRGC